MAHWTCCGSLDHEKHRPDCSAMRERATEWWPYFVGLLFALVMGVLFRFDPAPGGDIAGYECHAWRLPGRAPIACVVWYDARWPRESTYYAEAEEPGPGQATEACVEAVDFSGNHSECVGESAAPAGGTRKNVIMNK